MQFHFFATDDSQTLWPRPYYTGLEMLTLWLHECATVLCPTMRACTPHTVLHRAVSSRRHPTLAPGGQVPAHYDSSPSACCVVGHGDDSRRLVYCATPRPCARGPRGLPGRVQPLCVSTLVFPNQFLSAICFCVTAIIVCVARLLFGVRVQGHGHEHEHGMGMCGPLARGTDSVALSVFVCLGVSGCLGVWVSVCVCARAHRYTLLSDIFPLSRRSTAFGIYHLVGCLPFHTLPCVPSLYRAACSLACCWRRSLKCRLPRVVSHQDELRIGCCCCLICARTCSHACACVFACLRTRSTRACTWVLGYR